MPEPLSATAERLSDWLRASGRGLVMLCYGDCFSCPLFLSLSLPPSLPATTVCEVVKLVSALLSAFDRVDGFWTFCLAWSTNRLQVHRLRWGGRGGFTRTLTERNNAH